MEIIRGTYFHRPGPGHRLVRLGRTRKEANATLAEWKKSMRSERLASVDPWLVVRRNLLASMRKRCLERGWAPLSADDILHLWERAAGRCELSGIEFSLQRQPGRVKRPWAPSLDRRDSLQPYSLENCRLVCTAVNLAMNEWGQETLMRVARALIKG